MWRLLTAVVVSAAAMGVTWHLGWVVLGLALLALVAPLVGWLLVAPDLRIGLAGAVVVLAAVLSLLGTLPGRPGDRSADVVLPVLVIYAVVGIAAVFVAWFRQRSTIPVGVPVALGVLLLGLLCGGGPDMLTDSAPTPATAELLPLPSPLALVTSGDAECGANGHACARSFDVAGPEAATYDDLVAQLIRHLRSSKGWTAVGPDGGCTQIRRLNVIRASAAACVSFTESSSLGHPIVQVGVEMHLQP